MIYLCVLNQSVTPADFDEGPVLCQNLDCLSPLEPPYHSARLSLPGGELETLLCGDCMPQPTDGIFPQIWLQVVDPDQGPGRRARPDTPADRPIPVIRLSDVPAPPPPPPDPEGPRKRRRKRPLTWRALTRLEPRLRDLLAEARSHHLNRSLDFCANAVWYGYLGFRPGLKARLVRLVGCRAEKGGDLRTSEAYDLAYQTIYQALPDCRGWCTCAGR
jgi:hypothetical protein